MGLCKCPKKNMTSLFCFEHRVNVCEHCLVESHSNCVVQTYLQWLSDSDYDPNCSLCATPLSGDAPTVRLQCLHVFHWACVDDWARRLPPNTAPAGYRCPQCNDAVFPKPNQTSLLIERLRSTLSGANWARVGLGLPLAPEFDHPVAPKPASIPTGGGHSAAHTPQPHPAGNYRASTPATVLNVENDVVYSTSHNDGVSFVAARKKYGDDRSDTKPLLGRERDADSSDLKYQRRPAMEWARGLWRAKYGDGSSAPPVTGWRRGLIICFFTILILGTLLLVAPRLISSSDSSDPLLDPMANPNIRVADEHSFN